MENSLNGQPPPQQYQQQPPPPPLLGGGSFQHLLQQQHQQLQMFWNYQRGDIETATDFKNHQLPLARIKKIMKADEDVRMISAEAPILFAKACELFILELTIRSWLHAEENKRRTLQKNDIAAAITRTDIFDFLVDIVPRDAEIKDGEVSSALYDASSSSSSSVSAAATAGVPYYYPPPPPGMMMMGQPAGMDPAAMYAHRQAWQPVWQQGMAEDGSFGGGGGGMEGQHHGYVNGHPPAGS